MDKLKKIIEELNSIREESSLRISDEVLFEQAIKIYISNNINDSHNNKERINISATDKQKYLLKKLGIVFNDSLTKQEAYQLIKEKKER